MPWSVCWIGYGPSNNTSSTLSTATLLVSRYLPIAPYKRSKGKRPSRPPLFLVLIGLALHFLRFGYVYGDGDQDELIPAALRLLNNDLFTNDWLIQYVTSGVNVRTYFVALVSAFGVFVPLWLAVALLHVLVWCGVAYGIYAIAFELARDRIAASLGMLMALLITPIMTLGGNTVIHNALVPEGVAWALAIPGVALFLRKKWIFAGALLGTATWFHLLAGGLTAFVLGVVMLWRTLEKGRRYDLDAVLRFGGAFVAAFLPVLIPLALAQGSAAPESESPFYIHALFRNPHHHLFFSFELARHLRFWPLMILGVVSLRWLRRKRRIRHSAEIVRFWIVSFILCCASVVFVEVRPVELVAKLQFFKLTVPSALFASLVLSATIATSLPDGVQALVKRAMSYRKTGLFVAVLLCGVVLLLADRGTGRPGALLYPARHIETELGEVEAWARTQTSADALFAVPPSTGTFRSFGERSVVANWHAFVFDDRAMQTWYERLMDIAPISPAVTGMDAKPALDAAYHAWSGDEWKRLSEQYDIDYLLVRRDESVLDFTQAFQNDEWIVYLFE